MDESQARAEAERLNEAHAERDQFEWVAIEKAADAWAVVKLPRRERIDPLAATTKATPRPEHPPNPSSGPLNDLPGYH